MIVFLIGGFFFSYTIKKEVFPDFEVDTITISVAYPGTTPSEIEQSVILAIEEAIDGIDGIEEVISASRENSGVVSVELINGANKQLVYQDIQQAVDGITTFPNEVERPIVSMKSSARNVITAILYGDEDEWELKQKAYELKNRLTAQKNITQVIIDGDRDYEVKVEVQRETLEKYGLTLNDISNKIGNESVELSSGIIRADSGDILVRLNERRLYANEFADIPIITTDNGSVIKLGEIATITDGFAEDKILTTYNGKSAISFDIYRSGNQTPSEVSEAAKATLIAFNKDNAPKIQAIITRDMTDVYQQRLKLLLKNGFMGLLLVVIMLGLFLDFKLAFWVAMGIPISFLGAFIFLPIFDVSVNMISMFAFIISLGIVVDDAIIVGENIHEHRLRGLDTLEASIEGVKDMAMPLTFAILTNIVAFSPLFFIPGSLGSLFGVIPAVVTAVFLVSWVEAVYILPRHLATTSKKDSIAIIKKMHDKQKNFAKSFDNFIQTRYKPFLEYTIQYRYITIAIGFIILLIVLSYAKSGRLGFTMMPRVEGNRAVAMATLPVGSPMNQAIEIRDKLISAGEKINENIDERLLLGHLAMINENSVRVDFFFDDTLGLDFSVEAFNNKWRGQLGTLLGIDSILFKSDVGGPGGGATSMSLELSHSDNDLLEAASTKLANILKDTEFVTDVQEGDKVGKEEFTITLLPYAKTLGITATSIATQLRSSYFGSEAIRQQRGEHEVKVRVMLPKNQRDSLKDLYKLKITAPNGSQIPLSLLTKFKSGTSYSVINRRDGARAFGVNANVVPEKNLPQVIAQLNSEIFPELKQEFPGLKISFQGRQADTDDSMKSLMQSFILMLIVVYIMLVLPFGSYFQPIIVMIAIPFGVVGAFLGHLVMGYSLSVISVMGIVALAGVVINDTLVLIDYSNKLRVKNNDAYTSIVSAGVRRFRPIMLTTITTFGGLAPMIFERSIQAKFMIPMAISLGFGILFATLITLIFIPSLYMILEDFAGFIRSKLKLESLS
jgi:multidrug efflux pump subunit AcrB